MSDDKSDPEDTVRDIFKNKVTFLYQALPTVGHLNILFP